MKSFFTTTFVALGVIFLLLVIAGSIFIVTDPFNLRPLLFGGGGAPATTRVNMIHATAVQEATNSSSSPTQGSSSFVLSDAQRQAIQSLGVDPSKIPSTVSATQEACFVSVLGTARVAEIKAGAVPGALEFIRAKACI